MSAYNNEHVLKLILGEALHALGIECGDISAERLIPLAEEYESPASESLGI
jgi:hypothetical protein